MFNVLNINNSNNNRLVNVQVIRKSTPTKSYETVRLVRKDQSNLIMNPHIFFIEIKFMKFVGS